MPQSTWLSAVASQAVTAIPDGDTAADNPVRKIAFFVGLLLLFFRFSMLHQTLVAVTGLDLHVLYIVGIPALAGVFVAGGVQRSFRGTPTFYWVGFAVWLVIALPFSEWKGGSSRWLLGYFRSEFILLFVTAGLIVTWRECKLVMYAIAWGAVVSLLTAKVFQREFGGRAGLSLGTFANPNDFASHLILVLPFLLWIVLSTRSSIVRVAGTAGLAFGAYLTLASGSRGALLGLIIAMGTYMWCGTPRQRVIVALGAPVLLMIMLPILPRRSWNRIQSLWSNDPTLLEDTVSSQASRMYLLRTGLQIAIQHPLFGVGQGQFANYEGTHSTVVRGIRGEYQEAHNTYLAAASECGIPAFLFYLAGIISTFRLVNGVYREARGRPDCEDIARATFCFTIALAGFCTSLTFVNFTYFFYMPAMAGLAVAVNHAARVEFATRKPVAVQQPNLPWAPPRIRMHAATPPQ